MNNRKSFRSFLRCSAYCTAGSYDLLALSAFLRKKGYFTRLSRDILQAIHPKRLGDLFFFNHGCFVSWGLKKGLEKRVLEYVKEFSTGQLTTIEEDHFYFHYGETASIDTHERFRLDIITLDSEDSQNKRAISYGLAQSIKLESFEEEILDTIKKNNYLPKEIASKGTISLTRRAIFKRMGEIFIARSSINLNVEYLEAPEFFWRNPNLEPLYIMVRNFLDIPGRVMALNQKLDVLQELLDILNSQVQHRHSSLLESIIILLIAVEIIISLFQLHLV